MFSDVVILAGGLGTRLRSAIGINLPKPMAPVSGKPFLAYILDHLSAVGAKKIVLAVSYHHEVIEAYFRHQYRNMQITYSVEDTPLGTGGAICQAAEKLESNDFLVLNGDTLFHIDFETFYTFHKNQNAPISVALRKVDDTSRYGSVEINGTKITAFNEKAKSIGAGLINGGIYAINRVWLLQQKQPQKFSFERDLLQALAQKQIFNGMPFANYFVDMGIPEDYQRAKQEIPQRFPHDRFLFLDRDGVLNKRIVGDYVRNLQQWQWLPNAKTAAALLSQHFKYTFVVSNQQGIGKGLMTMTDVETIHRQMRREIDEANGHIDRVYVCPSLEKVNDPNRKPNVGMALQATIDFPEVNLNDSLMIGDSLSDIQFGWRCGMRCIYLTNGNPIPTEIADYTDLFFENLAAVPVK